MDPLKSWLNGQNCRLVLDVATGRGYSATMLADSFKSYGTVVGIDLSIDNLRQSRKNAKERNIVLLGMRAEAMAFPDNTFNMVAVMNSLHHFQSAPESLKEMRRVLKPGGHFIIYEMVCDNLNEKQISHRDAHHWWGAIDRMIGIYHRETYANSELRAMVGSLGLSEAEFIEFNEESEIDSPEVINTIDKTIDMYIEKIPPQIDRHPFIKQGALLKKRFRDIGFAWATILITIGTK